MNELEERLQCHIEQDEPLWDAVYDALLEAPLGVLSKFFCKNNDHISYLRRHDYTLFVFRMYLEAYLHGERTSACLAEMTALVPTLPSLFRGSALGDLISQKKEMGTYLLPLPLHWIRSAYMLDDMRLTFFMSQHFAIPPISFFDPHTVPLFIQIRHQQIEATLSRVSSQLSRTTEACILLQRRFRMHQRYREEIKRIETRDHAYLLSQHWTAHDLWREANTPYRPQCRDQGLAARIVARAGRIAAFTRVRHITSTHAISKIFDDALYGRKMLLNLYVPFTPSALSMCDILNGDANVICLGPQDIDAHGHFEIEFDVQGLLRQKTTAFYKQNDFGYKTMFRKRNMTIGSVSFSFDHTGLIRKQSLKHAYFECYDEQGGVWRASLPNSMLIAYDTKHMHQILTLNFFRWLDCLKNPLGEFDTSYADRIYNQLSQLDDHALDQCLTALELHMTDTSEFNFYGAYRIDFSSILSLKDRHRCKTLECAILRDALRDGDVETLRRFYHHFPQVFQSYRWLEYWMSQDCSEEIRYYLDDLRKRCETPIWIHYEPLPASATIEINWGSVEEDLERQEEDEYVFGCL